MIKKLNAAILKTCDNTKFFRARLYIETVEIAELEQATDQQTESR